MSKAYTKRAIVKKYWREISVGEARELLQSKFHEERMVALFILVAKFTKADDVGKPSFAKTTEGKREIFDLYLANTKFINNWDLVDLSAPNIVGAYLFDKDVSMIRELAKSGNFSFSALS